MLVLLTTTLQDMKFREWLKNVLNLLWLNVFISSCNLDYLPFRFLTFLYLEQAATKILARQLVRLRQQITNLQGSRAQIRGVATHTQVNKCSMLSSDETVDAWTYITCSNLSCFTGFVRQHLNFDRNERCN